MSQIEKENVTSRKRCGLRRLDKNSQLKLEKEYKRLNREVRKFQCNTVLNGGLAEKLTSLKKKLRRCNHLAKPAFETVLHKCIEYDSEYFVNAAEVNHIMLTSLQADSLNFDPKIFREKLITHLCPESRLNSNEDDYEFEGVDIDDFGKLGQKCSYLINTPPVYDYMYGSFDPGEVFVDEKASHLLGFSEKPKKTRLVVGRLNICGDITKPKTTDGIEKEDDIKNGREVEHIHDQLKTIYEAKNEEPIQYFKFVTNPFAFSDTVETIFHSAFLVKEGMANLEKSNDEPVIRPIEIDDETLQSKQKRPRNDDSPNKQSILTFSMNDWKKWIETYQLQDFMIKPLQK